MPRSAATLVQVEIACTAAAARTDPTTYRRQQTYESRSKQAHTRLRKGNEIPRVLGENERDRGPAGRADDERLPPF
jgi:hypothetical protein